MSDLLYKQNKTGADIDELLLQHKNLVYYKLAQMGQLNNPDAESAAWEALWDALMTFDIYSKTAFSTYACRCITNAVNSVLRKQQYEKSRVISFDDLSEANLLCTDGNFDSASTTQAIEQGVAIFVSMYHGLPRDIILRWQASGFEMSVTMLATACNTSTSYVSRVITLFRAILSSQMGA